MRTIKKILPVLFHISLLSSRLTAGETLVFEGKTYIQEVIIQETGKDILFRNCVFDASLYSGLVLLEAENVTVENCRFKDIAMAALIVPEEAQINSIHIENCSFENIGDLGIYIGRYPDERQPGAEVSISDCRFRDIGVWQVWSGESPCITVFTDGFRITGNSIRDVYGGSGILIGSSGTISGNTIGETYGPPILYTDSQIATRGDSLLIENNICWNSSDTVDFTRNGIIEMEDRSMVNNECIKTLILRFNTLISFDPDYFAISGETRLLSRDLRIYGNFGVHALGNNPFPNSRMEKENTASRSLDGFAGPAPPYDFHITERSPAFGAATDRNVFPDTDLYGNIRYAGRLDAGAHQLPGGDSVQRGNQNDQQNTPPPVLAIAEEKLTSWINERKGVSTSFDFEAFRLFSIEESTSAGKALPVLNQEGPFAPDFSAWSENGDYMVFQGYGYRRNETDQLLFPYLIDETEIILLLQKQDMEFLYKEEIPEERITEAAAWLDDKTAVIIHSSPLRINPGNVILEMKILRINTDGSLRISTYRYPSDQPLLP